VQAKNPNIFHLLFIRHAESSNNVLAEKITQELGGSCHCGCCMIV
jgi:hypothetical protein